MESSFAGSGIDSLNHILAAIKRLLQMKLCAYRIALFRVRAGEVVVVDGVIGIRCNGLFCGSTTCLEITIHPKGHDELISCDASRG
jgi:hypothetical protein